MSPEETAIIERFNNATNSVAAKIRDLIANPPANDDEFNAALGTIATGLEALGANGAAQPVA